MKRLQHLADLAPDSPGALVMVTWEEDDYNIRVPNTTIVLGGGAIAGTERCRAVRLRGNKVPRDCHQHRVESSAYCYYHDKLQRGLCDPYEFSAVYPVWPLPKGGYDPNAVEEEAA